MILGRVGTIASEDFSVTDQTNSLIAGIDSTSFVIHLFDPDKIEVSSTIAPTVEEMGYGHYRLDFIPNQTGIWYAVVYHPTYFPAGKSGTIQVFENDFDSVTTLLQRILGLTQENFYIDNTLYDNKNLTESRIRIYSDEGSVGSDSNVIATYNMNAEYDTEGNMTSYQVKKE